MVGWPSYTGSPSSPAAPTNRSGKARWQLRWGATLYHDLVKAGNRTLSDENRKTLRKAAYEIFIEQTHMAYTKAMLGVSNTDYMDQVFQGFHSVPTPYNDEDGLNIKMWNLNGTITTPVWRRLCGGILPGGQRVLHGA